VSNILDETNWDILVISFKNKVFAISVHLSLFLGMPFEEKTKVKIGHMTTFA